MNWLGVVAGLAVVTFALEILTRLRLRHHEHHIGAIRRALHAHLMRHRLGHNQDAPGADQFDPWVAVDRVNEEALAEGLGDESR